MRVKQSIVVCRTLVNLNLVNWLHQNVNVILFFSLRLHYLCSEATLILSHYTNSLLRLPDLTESGL